MLSHSPYNMNIALAWQAGSVLYLAETVLFSFGGTSHNILLEQVTESFIWHHLSLSAIDLVIERESNNIQKKNTKIACTKCFTIFDTLQEFVEHKAMTGHRFYDVRELWMTGNSVAVAAGVSP